MATPTAEHLEDVIEAVKAFNQGLDEGEDLEAQLSYFRAWYYVPELDAVGPSKFIGYKGMTAAQYMRSEDLDGRVTEPALSKWFDVLEEDTPEAQYVANLVEQLLRRYKKTPNRMARFNAPRGWRLDASKPTPAQVIGATDEKGPRPIVEVFWRAFLSLYPEDQDALAARIKQHRQRA